MIDTSAETPVLDTIAAMTAESLTRGSDDAHAVLAARIAALVAVDAPAASYLLHIGPAAGVELSTEEVQDILIAVAPIVGTARTLSAAIKITEALGVALVMLEEALEEEEAEADA